MSKNPLSPTYTIPETILRDQERHWVSDMGIPDQYYTITELSLRERIDTYKNRLSEIFLSIFTALSGSSSAIGKLENEAIQYFHEAYLTSLQKMANGQPATNCAKEVQASLCKNLEGTIAKSYPVAFIWIACADLMEAQGLREKSWSALLEFAYLDSHLDQACEAELKRIEHERRQKNSGQAYAGYENLKKHFIKNLSHKSPSTGWTSADSAKEFLADDMWNYQFSSDYHGNTFKNKDALKIRLDTWLKNHKDVKEAYKKNSKRMRKR